MLEFTEYSLSPLAQMLLGIFVLTVLLRLRSQPEGATGVVGATGALRYLRGYFVANVCFCTLLFLYSSANQDWQVLSGSTQYVAAMLGNYSLLLFAYHFPTASSERAITNTRWTALALSVAGVLCALTYLYLRLTGQGLYQGLLQVASVVLIVTAFWTLAVFTRSMVQHSVSADDERDRELQDESSRTMTMASAIETIHDESARTQTRSQTRSQTRLSVWEFWRRFRPRTLVHIATLVLRVPSRKHRAARSAWNFMLLSCVPILLYCVTFLRDVGVLRLELANVIINVGSLVYNVLLVLVYLNHAATQTSVIAKLTLATTTIVLLVLSVTGVIAVNFTLKRQQEVEQHLVRRISAVLASAPNGEHLARVCSDRTMAFVGYVAECSPDGASVNRLLYAADHDSLAAFVPRKALGLNAVIGTETSSALAQLSASVLTGMGVRSSQMIVLAMIPGYKSNLTGGDQRETQITGGLQRWRDTVRSNVIEFDVYRIAMKQDLLSPSPLPLTSPSPSPSASVLGAGGSAALYEVGFVHPYSRSYIHVRAAFFSVVMLVGTVLVLVGLPLFLRTNVIAPMRALMRGVSLANAGDMKVRVDMQYTDEIGFLADSFNQMIASMSVAEQEKRLLLEEQNRELEATVERRTSDLQRANAELSHAIAEKNDLLGIVAHDLKNPLSAISQAAATLIEWQSEGSAASPVHEPERIALVHNALSKSNERELHELILRSSSRMFALIKNLLEVNALENNAVKLALAPCSLNAVLDNTIERLEASARAKQQTIIVDGVAFAERSASPVADSFAHSFAHGSSGIMVVADDRYLEQVFDNLLSNAIKYSPHGATIFLETRIESQIQDRDDAATPSHIEIIAGETAPQTAQILIRDEGPGITKEDQTKLFQKFTRLTAQPTGDEHSTGLGLAIVKTLVTMMNGTVRCESAPETGRRGATFVVEMPVA
jgi:signal transduction histidine kinase